MEDMWFGWPFLIPITAIIGGILYAIVNSVMKARVRELEVRERIAMIERGLVPPPEVDPRGFDRAMDRYERVRDRSPVRHRRAGVTMLGVGFGLMVLLSFTADPSVALGVGGFLVIMGLAFFLNSLFDSRSDQPMSPPPPRYSPPPPPPPPATPAAQSELRRE